MGMSEVGGSVDLQGLQEIEMPADVGPPAGDMEGLRLKEKQQTHDFRTYVFYGIFVVVLVFFILTFIQIIVLLATRPHSKEDLYLLIVTAIIPLLLSLVIARGVFYRDSEESTSPSIFVEILKQLKDVFGSK
ncbi:hypothetical protein [Craterilacuibacter sp. RT1T]|uniref:hypothetical protein n=1 Tax=Craterilacuibacter sp. RT1T TaxID=2942211 RepID=UPI0020BE26B9|nr:hypothetical protein [Craterilacuibacter sp. RT1T]MCL6264379.1 hypothetical protein [Craterilacuibacter sp. RT1T]